MQERDPFKAAPSRKCCCVPHSFKGWPPGAAREREEKTNMDTQKRCDRVDWALGWRSSIPESSACLLYTVRYRGWVITYRETRNLMYYVQLDEEAGLANLGRRVSLGKQSSNSNNLSRYKNLRKKAMADIFCTLCSCSPSAQRKALPFFPLSLSQGGLYHPQGEALVLDMADMAVLMETIHIYLSRSFLCSPQRSQLSRLCRQNAIISSCHAGGIW